MAPTANNDNSNPAEAYSLPFGGSLQHAAGTLVCHNNIDVMNPENSEEYLPQSTTISPADPALASYERRAIDTNNHSSVAARSLESQSFTASPHFMCFPEASNSHSTSDIVSSCGMVDAGNTLRDIFQPSLQPFDTMGYLQRCASATCYQPYGYANNSMVLAHNISPYLAPFDAENLNNTPPDLEPPFDMGNVPFPQDAGNLESNYIGEQWASPAEFQPHFDFMGVNNVLLRPQPNNTSAFSMLPGPYADPASSQMLGPFDQHREPQPIQGYASDQNPQLLHTVSSRFHPESAESIGLPPTISQSVYRNNPWTTGIAEANDQLGNLGNLPQIQPPESFDYTDSFMVPSFSNAPPNEPDALHGPSRDIFPNVQQPTKFSGQGGVTSLDSHSLSVCTVGNSTIPNQLVFPYPIGDPMLSEAAEAPSTEIVLRPLEPITHPLASPLQVGTESSDITPGEAPSATYGSERPPQKSSRQLSTPSRKIRKPASGSKSLVTRKKLEERAKLELNRLSNRGGIPEDSIGYFGTCIAFGAKKRGKGTQKAARERGTCIRCHMLRLKCDGGEGDCCNNCQKNWATQATRSTLWRWTRNNWKSLAKAYVEWLQLIDPGIDHRPLWSMAEFSVINSKLSKDTWSMFVGVVDVLSGANPTSRWALSTSSAKLPLWGYAGQSLLYQQGFDLVNPELGNKLSRTNAAFVLCSWKILLATEELEKKPNLDYISILAYVLIEWESSRIPVAGQFAEWLLEAITTRLKVAISRFSAHKGHEINLPRYVFRMLNESATGHALLPEEYHGVVWSKRRERTAECLPHAICVDTIHHGEGCWCGLIIQSVPLPIIRFYGVLDAADDNDDNGQQWRDFIAKHYSGIRKLGEMNLHEMHKNGKYRRYMRSAFQKYLRLVLGAFFDYAQSWQSENVLRMTNRELMEDWETWRYHGFAVVLDITARQFLITVSNHTHEEILHVDPPRDRIFHHTRGVFQILLVARKLSILKAQFPGHPNIDVLECFLKESLDLRKSTGGETFN